jgi:miniconductance mechanosensitive channel
MYNIGVELFDRIEEYSLSLGLAEQNTEAVSIGLSLFVLAILSVIANFIAKKTIVWGLNFIVSKTSNTWDDHLVERKVFHKFSHLAPAFAIQFFIEAALGNNYPGTADFIEKLTRIYIIVACSAAISSLIDALHDMYQRLETSKNKPIKGYVQVVKLILVVFAVLISFAVMSGRNPMNILLGMGASAAVLMLVFKDTILGLVASVQISANNMLKIGDWLEMPSRGADGDVIEISLNTVKVQNWDRTITTIPTYALVSESFTNWRGMVDSGGRRIKRSLYIDISSVGFCSEELIAEMRKIDYIKDYIDSRQYEIDIYNRQTGADTTMPVNGRRMTNIGVFRRYLGFYMKNNTAINTEMIHMVRQLQPTDKGLPLEIYCFADTTAWVEYENIQSDIFDHVISAVPHFGLRLYQSPSGADIKNLSQFLARD